MRVNLGLYFKNRPTLYQNLKNIYIRNVFYSFTDHPDVVSVLYQAATARSTSDRFVWLLHVRLWNDLSKDSDVASYGALGHMSPSTSNNFIFSSLWSKSDSQLSDYCVVCKISWWRCQQLTALSPLLTTPPSSSSCCTRPWSSLWVPHDIISSFAPPRNKFWRRRCPKISAIPVFPLALLANISKRDCFLLHEAAAHLWQFDFYAPFIM